MTTPEAQRIFPVPALDEPLPVEVRPLGDNAPSGEARESKAIAAPAAVLPDFRDGEKLI